MNSWAFSQLDKRDQLIGKGVLAHSAGVHTRYNLPKGVSATADKLRKQQSIECNESNIANIQIAYEDIREKRNRAMKLTKQERIKTACRKASAAYKHAPKKYMKRREQWRKK